MEGTTNRSGRLMFPALPAYGGTWQPLYWTPVPGSEERFTAFVVAIGEDGAYCVRRTIREAVLRPLFNDAAGAIRESFAQIEASLFEALERAGSLTDWVAPLTGYEFGEARPARAENISQLAAQGVRMTASLADPHQVALDMGVPSLTRRERRLLEAMSAGVAVLPGRRNRITLGGVGAGTVDVMHDMARRGWVERDDYGHWHATDAGCALIASLPRVPHFATQEEEEEA